MKKIVLLSIAFCSMQLFAAYHTVSFINDTDGQLAVTVTKFPYGSEQGTVAPKSSLDVSIANMCPWSILIKKQSGKNAGAQISITNNDIHKVIPGADCDLSIQITSDFKVQMSGKNQ